MKKLYALCLLTLTAVVLDIVFLHPRSVTAQSNPSQMVHIERVQFGIGSTSGDSPITGRVVGFHCIDAVGGPQCFVASGYVSGISH
jgi:hypothetical protein